MIKIGPEKASPRKGSRNSLFVRRRKATKVMTSRKTHPTLWFAR